MPIQLGNSNPLSFSSNGKRKSAFSLYKPSATVLTNLQRGNTQANVQVEVSLNFHERAGQGEITEIQARQLPCIDEVDRNNLTPLHWACFYGQLSSVRILMNCGADITKLAPDHVSPLLFAAAGGHHEIVKLLLQSGADPNQTDIVSFLNCFFSICIYLGAKFDSEETFTHIYIIYRLEIRRSCMLQPEIIHTRAMNYFTTNRIYSLKMKMTTLPTA